MIQWNLGIKTNRGQANSGLISGVVLRSALLYISSFHLLFPACDNHSVPLADTNAWFVCTRWTAADPRTFTDGQDGPAVVLPDMILHTPLLLFLLLLNLLHLG